jgi:uroporphyrinogen-III synthase
VLACIGPRTAADAEAAGLRVDLVARERTIGSLIATLEELAEHRRMQEWTR